MRPRWKKICVFKNKAPRGTSVHSVLYLSVSSSRHHLHPHCLHKLSKGTNKGFWFWTRRANSWPNQWPRVWDGNADVMDIFFVYFLTLDSRSPAPAQASFSRNGNTSGACLCLPSFPMLGSHCSHMLFNPPQLLLPCILFVFIPLQSIWSVGPLDLPTGLAELWSQVWKGTKLQK